jgi:hypothetical protein
MPVDLITKFNIRNLKVFRLMFGYDSLMNYFKTNFALMQHHKYSLNEIENMIPWERNLFILTC